MGIKTSFYEQSWQDQYFITFYNAILQLEGNDINPSNITMFKTGVILLITGSFTTANLFGTMVGILGSINRKNEETQKFIEETTKIMKNMKLPE